ncbi:MAG: Mce protein, partial [Mycobacterium sp.]
MFGLVIVCALTALTSWSGFGVYESQRDNERREIFLQVGRQVALNLTTIDYQRADDDVRRILDSSTGAFYDDFSSRSKAFVDLVKQAQSKSVGDVTAAGLESETRDQAQV